MRRSILEVFFATLGKRNPEGGVVSWARVVHNITDVPGDPDNLVRAIVTGQSRKSLRVNPNHGQYIHSTSWRYESRGGCDDMVFTYIVLAGAMDFEGITPSVLPIAALHLANGATHDRPKPREKIRDHHVLAHALRHLAMLAAGPEKDIFEEQFEDWILGLLAQVTIALAGRLPEFVE